MTMVGKAAFDIFILCLRMIQSTGAVFANLLTIICIVKYKSLRNPAGILVASLAVSDTLHGLVMYTLPLRTLYQRVCIGSLAAETFTMSAQLMSFVLLAMERRNSLLAQLNRTEKWDVKTVGVIVIATWAAIATLHLVFALNITHIPKEKTCSGPNIFPESFLNGFFIAFVTATVVVVGFYGSIARIVQKSHRQVASNTAQQRGQHRADLQTTKMMALTVGIYLALYTPVCFSSMFMTLEPPFWQYVLDQLSLTILDINFWINPAIYAWRNKQFRKAFRNLFRGWRLCRTSDGNSAAVHVNTVSLQVNVPGPPAATPKPLVPRRDFLNSELQVTLANILITDSSDG